MNLAGLRIQTIESAPFAENTYVVRREGQADCVIVDPGFEPDKIIDFTEAHGLRPVAILNTHGHSDHIAGNQAMKERWPHAPLVIGVNDAEKLLDPEKNLSAAFGGGLISPPADELVQDGQHVKYAGIELHVLETPGHSRGHVVFVYEGSPHVVLGGDVLFRGSIGRTDFPDGSFNDLIRSIHDKLFVLADDSVVLPGHGPATTIGEEKQSNPFVGTSANT